MAALVTAKHDRARLERRREIARNSARHFEDQLSAAELVLVRLNALPDELREQDHDALYEKTEREIRQIKVLIASMYDEAGPEPAPESNGDAPNRAQRRAKSR